MKIELLAPAGSMEGLRAAVSGGADAVYLGGTAFGARSAAENFAELDQAVSYCHLRGVRAYLTVNTLVKDGEFSRLDELICEAAEAGIDACIVQDIAVAGRIRELVPGMPLHASTQMALMGRYGARFAWEWGFARAIAARECSLEAIQDMAAELPTEVFVHGALCTSYSGQCLMSSLIGGRSGNRGRCAQPCRLPYAMQGERGYWLSTRDLCLIDRIPELLHAGAAAFKIEGRLRRPEYAAIATAAYRRALDAAIAGVPYDSARDRQDLFAMFNRGEFTDGYAFGGTIVNPERPNHGGVYVGEARADGLHAETEIHKGDSLEIRPSGRGFAAERDVSGFVRMKLPAHGALYRTVDARLMHSARESYAQEKRPTAIDARVVLVPGGNARLRLGAVEVEGDIVQEAKSRPLSIKDIRRSLDRFDEYPWRLGACEMEGENAFLPVASLNALRRAAIVKLAAHVLKAARGFEPPAMMRSAQNQAIPAKSACTDPLLVLQSAEINELCQAAPFVDELYYAPSDWRIASLTRDFHKLPESVRLVLPFWLEGEYLEKALDAFDRRRFVAGSPGQLALLKGHDVISDYTVHAASARAVRAWLSMGAVRAALSPELTLGEMTAAAQGGAAEMIAYGRLTLMTLRHCPASARATGEGGCAACGLRGALIDRKGETFSLVKTDAQDGCRVTLLNAHTLSCLSDVHALRTAGAAAWRVIGAAQDARAVRDALDGKTVKDRPGLPVTRGHWFRGVE